MKNIFCIRHGLAFHNIKAMEIGSDAYLMEECFDAPLVEKGIKQAKDLGNQWKGLNAGLIVFVSPLTRTLQTCQEIFQTHPEHLFYLLNCPLYLLVFHLVLVIQLLLGYLLCIPF